MLNFESLPHIYPQLSVNKTKWKRYATNPASHSDETKRTALKLVAEGLPVKEVAKVVGCGPSTLNLWRKKARDKLNSVLVEA